MNLQEFIDYRLLCPMCNSRLSTGFVSKRRQNIRLEENNMTVYFPLEGINVGQKDYKVSYSFGLKDQSICVEFYTLQGDKFYNVSHMFLIDRFKQLHTNLKLYKFYRGCTVCHQYSYGSQNFDIDLSEATYGDLKVWSEELTVTQQDQSGKERHRNYKLTNIYGEDKSYLYFWKSNWQNFDLNYLPPSSASYLILPIVPLNLVLGVKEFEDKLLEKLNTIITFS